MYDYGARMYMPELGRWGTSDRKGELYLSKSPYSYANNTPVNAIDPDGNLVIFINGQHGGDGGKADYWRQYERKLRFNSNLSGGVTYRKEEVLAFDKAVMEQLGDHHAIYRDGALGGWNNTLFAEGNVNTSFTNRTNSGYSQGIRDAENIIASLARDSTTGEIIETIKIISHSMGGAYAKGYVKALLQYAKANNINGVKIAFEADFAPFQPDNQEAVKAKNMGKTLQFSHNNDMVAGNKHMKGAENQDTSDDKKQGHSIFYFMNQINKLPSGVHYINGIKVTVQGK
ncbi:hypothetical protein BAX96_02490 [Elizabethkingia anophelis]|nr:RHS repeat-associated core domain-containing protein [Elizabethkingia anophelis]EJC8058676.1 hypothetical protein [Elizabethkingia anophelis]MCL1640554.1 hypothetical protein [Elizabethkingia anophelis]MCL1645028.1 hypothetical protein [Elizabethkingia anophelis]MCT3755056.1 hypothetical protein [Elizabethkingia anophelis]MCT4033202.1 hypothetical protein [Elizabethkingia anophelis]